MPRHLILDIETNSKDIKSARCRVFGGYDIEEDKYIILKFDPARGQNVINQYDWIITFNGEYFDIPILINNGIKNIKQYNHIDLFKIVKYKRNTMIIKDGFNRFSLREIIKTLNLDELGKGDIDYKIFQKEEWTKDEQDEIVKYLKQDLTLTFKLWKYLNERFESFAHFIDAKDVMRYKHITTSSGAYAYKAICYMTGLPERYNDAMGFDETYEGAYVSDPAVDNAKGLILDFDFASLYPWMDIQGNLFSHSCTCCTKEEKWHGNDFFKVQGYYCRKAQGIVESKIKELYYLRKEYKKNKDKREAAVKILINSIYGISGSPKFASLYDINTASDCTGLGRQCIKYAREEFSRQGYNVLYTDTDSVYIQVPTGKTKEQAIECANNIASTLANNFNFPHPQDFTLKVDEEIKYIQFFGKKKHYLYVNMKNELTVKGLQIIKRDCTKLSQKIFNEYLKPQIINNLNSKFNKDYITGLIYKLLQDDITLAVKKFSIKTADDYKSKTSIQYEIFRNYGEGEHNLIKNYKTGIGKGVKYCKVEDAQKLSVYDIDIEIFLNELDNFIETNEDGGLDEYF